VNAVYDLANRLTSWNGTAVTNDLNGNMTAQGGLSYTYNARNQLTTVKQGGTTLGAYVADGLGRRARKTIGGTVTRPVYDGWNVVQERSSNGNQVTANLLVGLGLDDVFVRTDAAQREFLSDALGSTVALADTAGVVQTSYTYEPFGNTTISGASNSSPYEFTGARTIRPARSTSTTCGTDTTLPPSEGSSPRTRSALQVGMRTYTRMR
jgi:YD repeat-containing protein